MKLNTLILEEKKNIIKITINREAKLNALSQEVFAELDQVLKDTAKKPYLKGLIITGAGEKAFVAGADISEMAQMNPEEGEAYAAKAQAVTEFIENLPFPVVACVNGYALGGGCELAMACDTIYASENAIFGQPEVKLGLIPGFGGCVRLIRYVGLAKAKELIYSGKSISAKEASTLGLVSRVFTNKQQMLSEAECFLENTAKNSMQAISQCKQVINSTFGCSTAEALEIERKKFRKVFATEDKLEGIDAFLNKRSANFH